jgi:hypothetical protein
MTRTLAASVVLTTLIFCLRPAAAAEPPWCAVIQNSTESVYWDCQYNSIEQCRQIVLAGNRGWCNANPYFVPSAAAPNKHYRKRHTRLQ